MVLDEYQQPSRVFFSDQPPHRLANVRGQPRRVLPTLVSFDKSNAFKMSPSGQLGPGQLYNTLTKVWESPTVYVAELLFGFDRDDTDGGPLVSPLERLHMLSHAIDGSTLEWFAAILDFLHPQ